MATIKIKFKDIFTKQKSVDIAINFESNGTTFNHFTLKSQSNRTIVDIQYAFDANNIFVYNYNSSSSEGAKWNLESSNYQYIEIDTTQANFNTFITAMKSNIEGVELEAGTYKWVDEPTIPAISFVAHFTFITTGSYDYIKISGDTSHIVYTDFDNDTTNVYTFSNKDWWNNTYKAITTTENQYVDYDFYNYAILGNQLVKQGGSGGTNKLKFGDVTPTKLYIGDSEVTKAYMGETLVYEK